MADRISGRRCRSSSSIPFVPQQPRRMMPVPAFSAPLGVSSRLWRSAGLSPTPLVSRRRPFQNAVRMGTSMPEIPEVSLPEPKVPEGRMDPAMGDATGVVTVDAAVEDETWLDSLLAARLPLPPNHPLTSLRTEADAEITDLPLPGRKQESWRFTNLRSVYDARYVSVDVASLSRQKTTSVDIRKFAPDTAGVVLVLVDGVLNEELSILNDESAQAWQAAGGHFGSIASYGGDVQRVRDMLHTCELDPKEAGLFPALGNASATDVVVLDIPEGFAVPRPVAIVNLSSGGDDASRSTVCAPRIAVISRPGSKVTLLEWYTSLTEEYDLSLTLPGTGVAVEENACVSHFVVNDVAAGSQLIGNMHSEVKKAGSYMKRVVTLGGKVGRFTTGIGLDGEGAHALLHGAALTAGHRVQDLHTRIRHDAKKTTSEQLQKNVSTGNGRAVFCGKIEVTKNGDGTDSSQLTRSLLLSEKSSVDAMPVLEIATDDVTCSHGATVADLGDNELFYCRSRGLSHRQAQSLLLMAFVLETIGDCPFPTVEARLREEVEFLSEVSAERELAGVEFISV